MGEEIMKFKKTLLVFCLIICVLFCVSSVAAGDVNDAAIVSENQNIIENQDPVAASEATVEVDDEKIESDVISSSNGEILNAKDNGTFTALKEKINNADENATITLENDYTYDEGFSRDGIIISKSITLDGNNHILDAKSLSRIFSITTYDNVTLKNIIFKNAYSSDNGGAIALGIFYTNFSVINSTFINCHANYGGAIFSYHDMYNERSVITAYCCKFVNCYASEYGGATCRISSYNCTFNGNHAKYGGAISGGKTINSVFSDCYADYGGAIHRSSAVNCNFTSNTAHQYGGAIYDSDALNSSFTSNHANDVGGAVYNANLGGSVVNCTFKLNTANQYGGAIDGGTVVNSTFENCTAGENGGALYNCLAKNCTFKNCSPQDMYDMNPNLKINANDIVEGEIAIVNITIDEKVTGNITVSIDGKEIDVVFSHGRASIPIADLSTGSHIIKVEFSGDEIYKKVNKQITLHVKIKTQLSINITNIDNSHALLNISVPYNVYFTIIVSFGNEKQSARMVEGKTSFYLDNLKVGDNITVTFEGSSNYMPCSQWIIFKGTDDKNTTPPAPVEYPVKIVASNLNMMYSAGSAFKVTVYGTDGKLASGESVVIKVDGKAVSTAKTNSNGVATYKPTQKPGSYKISATALGKTVTKTITVKHLVTLKAATVKKSAKKLVLQATLGKVNGKYLKSKKVTFKFNGKKYTAKTNAKGVAKVTVKSAVLKKLKVGKKVTYQATYLKDTVKKTAKIKK